jgi:Na+/H+ antiporter NhaD/arsenite permease-like protein
MKTSACCLPLGLLLLGPAIAVAGDGGISAGFALFAIPVEFLLFAATLAGVALFHRHTLPVALVGLVAITAYKFILTGFHGTEGLAGLGLHLAGEWTLLANLGLLLVGFALLSRHFEDSGIPARLPALLPDDWKGGFGLLAIIFVLSSFLDNIAAAIIGATIAQTVFRQRVHIGYLAAIVAASNAGGSGSVVGDTTTTMMWIEGVRATHVVDAYIAATVALVVCGIPASIQQQRYSPIVKSAPGEARMDWGRITIVAAILLAAMITNLTINLKFPQWGDRFPFIGASVWVALLAAAPLRRPDWSVLPGAFKGSLFLLALVTCASMMPVESLPAPSWRSTFALGVVSAVFDNIPLTKLALEQNGYDWGMLAYAVGFGGSMIWFGSSAGVAVSNLFPEARSVWAWLKSGWHVALAYVLGFVVLLAALGWVPALIGAQH